VEWKGRERRGGVGKKRKGCGVGLSFKLEFCHEPLKSWLY
jgi:hypothetical protein